MSKKKMRVIIIIISVFIFISVLPFIFIGVIFGGLTLYNMGTPDHSKDPLIPSGYVETDGEQGYGAGDVIEYNYYTYDSAPQLDDKFITVTKNTDELLPDFLKHLGGVKKWGELDGRITDGDLYIIDKVSGDRSRKWGALIYFYDHESKTLHRIDFCW